MAQHDFSHPYTVMLTEVVRTESSRRSRSIPTRPPPSSGKDFHSSVEIARPATTQELTNPSSNFASSPVGWEWGYACPGAKILLGNLYTQTRFPDLDPMDKAKSRWPSGFPMASLVSIRSGETTHSMKNINLKHASQWPLWAVLFSLLLIPGCNSLNPLCASARPAPVMGSLSAPTITFAQVQQGFALTVTGSQFVSSTVVVINGTTLQTTVVNSQQLQVTITTDLISGPGTASVTVNTPSGNTGYAGCTSGGTSSALTLTIT